MTQLIRFSPTQDIRRMQNEIDRLFGAFLPTMRSEESEAETAVWAPRTDLHETGDAYVIHADLPGVPKEDVNVNYHDGILSVSGERRAKEPSENENCVRLERSFGRFYRSFTLPKTINEKKISATFLEGVLTIHVPKAEESKPRRIQVS